MARDLLQELDQQRTKDMGTVEHQQILDGAALDWAFEQDGFLDRIIEDMKRRAWLHALTLGWLFLRSSSVRSPPSAEMV